MVVPEFEAHGRRHRSLEFDSAGNDEERKVNQAGDSYPTPDDHFDSETLKYVAIGSVAAKRLHDKRKES